MWQYNFDYLCHSSHKYIDKTYKNGRWYYTYDNKKGVVRSESVTSPTNYAVKMDTKYAGLNPKARGIILGGTRRTGHRDNDQKIRAIDYLFGGDRFTSQMRKKIKQKQENQNFKDRNFSSKERQLQNAKAAEKEHSDKTKSMDEFNILMEKAKKQIQEAYEKDAARYANRIKEVSDKYGPYSKEAYQEMKEAVDYLNKKYPINTMVDLNRK